MKYRHRLKYSKLSKVRLSDLRGRKNAGFFLKLIESVQSDVLRLPIMHLVVEISCST